MYLTLEENSSSKANTLRTNTKQKQKSKNKVEKNVVDLLFYF